MDPDHGHPDLVFRPDQTDGILQALHEAGCFVVRGLFDPAAVDRIRQRAIAAARETDARIAAGNVAELEAMLGSAYTSGHLPPSWIDPAQTQSDLFVGSAFDHLAAAVFGTISYGFSLRSSHVNGEPNAHIFHQDAFFTPALGYNFWTPLADAGLDLPSVEVIVGSGAPLFPYEAFLDEESERLLRQCYAEDAFWHPLVRAGDALVFTSFMMHRTHWSPNMTQQRFSLEIRGPVTCFAAIAGVPADPTSAPTLSELGELPSYLERLAARG